MGGSGAGASGLLCGGVGVGGGATGPPEPPLLLPPQTGWVFGERLHDQERGWFPSNMTEEILNPKIRSQNLKECFRVHKMEDPQRSQNKDRRKLGSRNRQ